MRLYDSTAGLVILGFLILLASDVFVVRADCAVGIKSACAQLEAKYAPKPEAKP